jgi:hypothetical protein
MDLRQIRRRSCWQVVTVTDPARAASVATTMSNSTAFVKSLATAVNAAAPSSGGLPTVTAATITVAPASFTATLEYTITVTPAGGSPFQIWIPHNADHGFITLSRRRRSSSDPRYFCAAVPC